MRQFDKINPLLKSPSLNDYVFGIKSDNLNIGTFLDYFYRLQEMAINMFDWQGVPDTIDVRFLELTLCEKGYAVYFNEPSIGDIALTVAISGVLDIYRIPTKRHAYAVNGFHRDLTNENSVIIYNNYLHLPTISTLMLYARRLTEIERTIEVNVKAQKTPILIACEDSQRLTMENLYKKYSGNEPVIFGAKNLSNKDITAITTAAPFVADKLQLLKKQIWNEALTFLGVENVSTEKKERLVSDEVETNLGAVQAQRFIMLNSRREAVAKINKMFGTNISVDFKEETIPDSQHSEKAEQETAVEYG